MSPDGGEVGQPGFPTPLLRRLVLLALWAALGACGVARGPDRIGSAAPTTATEGPTATPAVLARLGDTPAPAASAAPVARPGDELKLRVGEETRLGADGPSVRFVRVVEDSRCPAGAHCIWQGRVVVELGVTSGQATTITLGTLEGFADAPATAEVAGFTLSIADVEPYPETSGPIPVEQYVLTLAVR